MITITIFKDQKYNIDRCYTAAKEAAFPEN